MRAYMSTGAGHAEDGSRYVCGLNVESAMAEARAILAETEPASRCPEAVTACYSIHTLARSVRHPGIAFTLPHDVQSALAESLAGFIGAEV